MLNEIPWDEFDCSVFRLWAKDTLLLCAGDFSARKYNMMTVGWGSFGVIWGKPFAMILVRPQRFTASILDEFPSFTLNAFPESMRNALAFCGSKSGRDYLDKASAAGLTAQASSKVGAPGFAEAELVIECVKTYRSELAAKSFLPPSQAAALYPANDYHRVCFGEITVIRGTDAYRRTSECAK